VFADESGFMLQPTVRRTWAPQGRTPILASYDRRDRLSAISALTVSPVRRRLGLYFDILDHNVQTDDFEAFVDHLLRRLGRSIILIIDRYSVHRAAVKRLLARHGKRLQIEWLPAYAPELNPDEQVWNHTKYADLANFVPDDVLHLGRSVAASLRDQRSQQRLLRSFFKYAKLPL
jgi:transposase